MAEDVTSFDAKVIRKRRLQALEVPSHFINELKPHLRVGRAAADVDLEAAVGQTEPRRLR